MSRGARWLAAAYGLLVFSSLKDISNPDIFWHLSAGRRILAEGRVPNADWLSFTRAGAAWVDFEWLAQLIFAAIHRACGWWGLIALKIALLAGAARLIERHWARRGLDAAARACAVFALTALWAISNDLRPEWISVVFLCAELAWLESAKRAYSWTDALGACVGGAIWANGHGGFVLGLAVAALYAGLGRVSWSLVLAGLAGTFLTPYGAKGYAVVLAHLRDGGMLARYIVEWRATSPLHLLSLPMWALLGGWIAAAFVLRPKRAEAAPWLVLAALALMALRHERHVAFFAAAGVLFLPLRPELVRWGTARVSLAALAATAFLLLTPQRLSRAGLALGDQPVETARFLQDHPEVARLRLYNPWGWGGYLGWSVGGSYRVYYDGRYLFHDLLAPSMEAAKNGPAWNAFLDEQRLDGAVLDRRTRRVRLTYREPGGEVREREVPEAVALMPPERWKLVHADATALVFLRR